MRMEKEMYKAAIEGDENFLKKERRFLSQTTIKHNNIIHLAVQHGRVEFLKKALPILPHDLVSQCNSAGETPLHIAAKEGDMSVIDLFVKKGGIAGKSESPPWKMKNAEGNTPLHLALIHGKVSAATRLLDLDPDVASVLNDSKETPLHLAARYSVHGDKELLIGAIQIINTKKAGLTYKGCVVEDDSLSIIELLLQKNRCAPCLYELTPLLRAALKSHVGAIRSIVSECPESVELFDSNGRTILHLFKSRSYEEAKELLNITEIQALKNVQDRDGNTPIHMAVENGDVHMVRALLECSANLTIKNKEGVSAAALIHQQPKDFLATKILEVDLNVQPIMAKEVFEAAVACDLDFLKKKLNINERECLLYRTNDRRNIIHVAAQARLDFRKFQSFLIEALERLPILLCQIDSNGDTPLHLSIRNKFCPVELISKCKYWFEKAKVEALGRCHEQLYLPPWRVKNVNGNTPIHEALLVDTFMAIILIQLDPDVVHDVNNDKQTILHLFCMYVKDWETDKEHRKMIIEADEYAIDALDSEGFTPLLRTGSNGWSWEDARMMVDRNPEIMMQCDNNGNTVLHLMSYSTEFNIDAATELVNTLKPLWFKENNEGNTPPLIALRERNFKLFKIFLEQKDGHKILDEKDHRDSKIKTLLGSTEDIPAEFRKFLWSKVILANKIFGYRSMCGIPTTEIKDYINTIGVTAALLATITFTAAFTVPGGLNSDDGTPVSAKAAKKVASLKGTPIFARNAAFSVFMVSDIAAMCFSMVVLFCLLWIMSGDPREKVVLLDFSVLLLQASFYATLVAFMAGVYVTIFPVAPWLAILTLVACCVLLLLMRNRIVMGAVPELFRAYRLYMFTSYLVRESLRYLKCRICRFLNLIYDDSQPNFFQDLSREVTYYM